MSDYYTHNERRKGAHVSGTYPVLEMPVSVEHERADGVEIERVDAAEVESISVTGEFELPAFLRRQAI